MRASWYVSNKDQFTTLFGQINSRARNYLSATRGESFAREMCDATPGLFEQTLTDLPDIGGDRNRASRNLLGVPIILPFYLAGRGMGVSAEEAGLMAYKGLDIMTQSVPDAVTAEAAEEYFSPGQFESIKAWARWTQEREFPDNYVAVAVEGDGGEFDFGYDYTECAIIKAFNRMGYPELAPYACFQDYPLSRLDGRGLARTKTLAWGDDVCDFRFKKGRRCTQFWDGEIDMVRERIRRQSNGCNR